MPNRKVIWAATLLLGGLATGYGLAMFFSGDAPVAEEAGREILYWVAPMDPNYRRDEPGISPMGMELIPVYADEAGANVDEPSLRISSAMINAIGVRTAPVERRTMHSLVRTVGNVRPNENLTYHVHVRAPGWIDELRIRSVGEQVRAGDLLFSYFAPDLVNAQAEYIQSLASGRQPLIEASRTRLRALGVSDSQISRIGDTLQVEQMIEVRALQDGAIIALNVGEGMYVQPGTTLMSLTDLRSVWVLVDIFEDDAPRVAAGMRATMHLAFDHGRIWEGQVDYVYPTINPVSRTLQVRLVFDDVEGALLPNMYGDIEIHGEPRIDVLAMPTEALIRASNGDRVVLALGDGRFRPARVETGIEEQGFVEVVGGLNEGEVVVTSGQFLIDSEANLDMSLMRLTSGTAEDEPVQPAVHDHNEPAMEEDGPATPSMTISVNGVLQEVLPGGNRVRIAHDPVPEIGWPSMTMEFPYGGSQSLSGLAPGTPVRFELTRDSDAGGSGSEVPVVTLIERIATHSGGHE